MDSAMKIPGRGWSWGLLVAIALAGCGKQPQSSGTGAREATQRYFEALMHRDWESAYAVLDVGSKARCTQEQFSQLAQTYRGKLGFEPDAVIVRACDEQDAVATAHVVLTAAATKDGRFKDAITLHRSDHEWHVVLSPRFGQVNKRKRVGGR